MTSFTFTTTTKCSLCWQGSRYASFTALLSGIGFILLELFPLWFDPFSLKIIIGLIIVANLFVLPFAVTGGYLLGWLIKKMNWQKADKPKAMISGAIIATSSLILIFVIGGAIHTCITSHGQCNGSIIGYTIQLAINELKQGIFSNVAWLFLSRFLIAFPIATVAGGIIGWFLASINEHGD